MSAVVSVLYPNDADARFDFAYYLGTHMPMVAERFGPHGLKGWRVVRGVAGPDGAPAPFGVIAFLEFGAPGDFAAAVAAEGEAVFGDVPNFTSLVPVVTAGEVVGAG